MGWRLARVLDLGISDVRPFDLVKLSDSEPVKMVVLITYGSPRSIMLEVAVPEVAAVPEDDFNWDADDLWTINWSQREVVSFNPRSRLTVIRKITGPERTA